jgi:transcriptional regulator with XRE-family HTH domain
MDGQLDGRLVGQRLFEWLDQTGEASGELAAQEGLSPTTVSHLLNNRIKHPRLSTVRKLARHFDVSVEEFLAGPNESAGARTRVVEELRALPFEARMALLENVEKRNEPFDPAVADRLSEALEDMAANGTTLDITPDEFFDFLTYANAEEAREVLFAGTTTEAERREAADKFTLAITHLIREGRLAAQDAVERLAVATQIQVKTA